jgi:hypothetical protein
MNFSDSAIVIQLSVGRPPGSGHLAEITRPRFKSCDLGGRQDRSLPIRSDSSNLSPFSQELAGIFQDFDQAFAQVPIDAAALLPHPYQQLVQVI